VRNDPHGKGRDRPRPGEPRRQRIAPERSRKSMKLDTLTPGGRRPVRELARTDRRALEVSETIRTIRETDVDGAIAANAAVGWGQRRGLIDSSPSARGFDRLVAEVDGRIVRLWRSHGLPGTPPPDGARDRRMPGAPANRPGHPPHRGGDRVAARPIGRDGAAPRAEAGRRSTSASVHGVSAMALSLANRRPGRRRDEADDHSDLPKFERSMPSDRRGPRRGSSESLAASGWLRHAPARSLFPPRLAVGGWTDRGGDPANRRRG